MQVRDLLKNRQFLLGLVAGLVLAALGVGLFAFFTSPGASATMGKIWAFVNFERPTAEASNLIKITGVSPARNVKLREPLTITFSGLMVPEEKIGREEPGKIFSFKPEINGTYKWIGQKTLLFTPLEDLKPGVTYRGTFRNQFVPMGKRFSDNSIQFRTMGRRNVKFTGLRIQGEMSLKPVLVFNFSAGPDSPLGQIYENDLFEFSPALKGHYHWATPTSLVFNMDEALSPHTTYSVKIKSERFNTPALNLTGKLTAKFTTTEAKAAKLLNVEPSGEIDPRSNLTFTFNEDVADYQYIEKNFRDDSIRVEPAVPGSYRWVNARQLRFLPETPFKPASSYKVTLEPGVFRTKAFYMAAASTVTVKTREFEVVSCNIKFSAATETASELDAKLIFNYPVNAEELEKHLTIAFVDGKKETKLAYKIRPYAASDTFDIVVSNLNRTDKARQIRLRVTKGLVCSQAGSAGLKADYVANATLSPLDPIEVSDVRANSGFTMGTATIEFTKILEKESVEAFISITPKVPYKVEVSRTTLRVKSEEFKPGKSFELTLKKGLPSSNGLALAKDHTVSLDFPDLDPLVRFNAEGYYLSSKGYRNLAVETVNVNQIDVTVYKVFANNIVHFLADSNDDESGERLAAVGKPIHEFSVNLKHSPNTLTQTVISLANYMEDQRKGIFKIFVREHENYWLYDSKMVIATDIGIVTKKAGDDLLVWANSLKSLQPLNGAKVTLLSYNNQVITTGETNRDGLATFNKLSTLFKEFEPYVVLVEYKDDFSFLKLSDCKLDLTDFDTSGRSYLTDGYEAYLYTDRGVYRPGEEAHVTAIVRGSKAAIPPDFPVRLKIDDPTGKTYSETVKSTGKIGAADFAVSLPDYVKTGKYVANLFAADQNIGTVSFNVEEFMPDRIKVEVSTDKDSYSKGTEGKIQVKGVNLFGPPAAGRRVELAVRTESVPFSPTGFASYTFGDPDVTWKPTTDQIGNDVLDAKGLANFTYHFPEKAKPGGLLKASFIATVREEGGRAVTAYKSVNFHAYETYIGMKRLKDFYGKTDEPYNIQFVEVDKAGKPVQSKALDVRVYRIIWNSVYQRDEDGNWYYDSEKEEDEVYKSSIKAGSGERTFSYTPRDYGEYKVIIANPETGARSAINFYATGWGYSPWAMNTPMKIELDLDKKMYEPGDTAKIQVKAPFNGKALVTVERERVYETKIVDFKDNTGVITLNVKEEWLPNVYVSVQLIRPIESLEKHAPVRAFGTISLPVNSAKNKLDVKIDAAEVIRPNQTVEVEVEVPNAGKNAYLTLAAVDEGILQLTGFANPDPYAFFYGKKKLDVESFDLYNMILPEVEKVEYLSSPGGDMENAMLRQNLNPVSVRRVKPVSLWSGIVNLDGKKAKIKLAIPQFNGTIRLMAAAYDGAHFGAAKKAVIVRDPIVLTPTYPRAVAGKDIFQVPVGVFNGTGKAGKFTVQLKIAGPVTATKGTVQEVSLDANKEAMVYFTLQAQNAAGKVSFRLDAEGNGAKTFDETEMSVRPATPYTSKYFANTLAPGQTTKLTLPGGWVPGTESYKLTISAFPAVKFSGSLKYLLEYPYGCAEQTTSKLFPLLYFDKLAEAAEPELFKAGRAANYMKEGIAKLQRMQMDDGGFSYWPGGDYSNVWTSLYVVHFLVEARKAEYEVSNTTYDKMLEYARMIARGGASSKYELQNKVYALYILALAGKADLSNMAYIKNHQLNSLYEDSRTLLAAAYYYAGEQSDARRLLPLSFAKSTLKRESGGNFNSSLRTYAIILSVLADIEPTHPAVQVLVERLSEGARIGYWGTTQENAFAFMAIGKILKRKPVDKYSGKVFVDNKEIASFTQEKDLTLSGANLGKGQITISVSGKGAPTYYAEAKGVPLTEPVKEFDSGMKVRREYLNRDGKPLNLKAVKQGDLIVEKITIATQKERLNNLVIVDIVPAALEIENPRLGSQSSLSWLEGNSFPTEYMDIRDDRLMLFTSLEADKTYTFYYTLRAVSVGEFTIPSIKAECMYEPEVASVASGGKLTVVK